MPPRSEIEKVPSGYDSSEYLGSDLSVDASVLPWLESSERFQIHVSKMDVTGSKPFLIASVIGSNKHLIQAASGMTDHQSEVTNNMFYSRLPGFLETGQSSNVDTLDESSTAFPIKVMRNKSGQRVYFARVNLGLPEEEQFGPTILRLGVCDKNHQMTVMKVLSGSSGNQIRNKMRGSK